MEVDPPGCPLPENIALKLGFFVIFLHLFFPHQGGDRSLPLPVPGYFFGTFSTQFFGALTYSALLFMHGVLASAGSLFALVLRKRAWEGHLLWSRACVSWPVRCGASEAPCLSPRTGGDGALLSAAGPSRARGPDVPRVSGAEPRVLPGPVPSQSLSRRQTLCAFFQVSARIKATQRAFA